MDSGRTMLMWVAAFLRYVGRGTRALGGIVAAFLIAPVLVTEAAVGRRIPEGAGRGNEAAGASMSTSPAGFNPEAAVYWEEGFEDLAQAPSAPSPYPPFEYVEQGNYCCQYYYPDKNVIALDSFAHSGSRSLRFTMNRSEYPIAYDDRRIRGATRWDKYIVADEVWRSVWMYLPDNFVAGDWITMLEFKAAGSGTGYAKWWIGPVARNGKLYMTFYDHGPLLEGKTTIPAIMASEPIPTGKWVRVQIYFRRDAGANGEMIVWQDTDADQDVEVIHASGFTSEVDDPVGYPMYICWDYYSPYGPNTVYWDDMVLASEWVPRSYAPGDAAASIITVGPSDGYDYPTIQAAVDAASPGDVVEVHQGTYMESVQLHKDGAADQWITVRAAQGEAVWIDGTGKTGPNLDMGNHAYWRIEGIKGRYAGQASSTPNVDGIRVGRGAHDIVIQAVVIQAPNGDAIDLEGQNQDVSVLDSEAFDMRVSSPDYEGDGHGIHVTIINGGPSTADILVRNNYVHDSHGKACLALADFSSLGSAYPPTNVVFEYNKVVDCTNGIKVNADGIFRYNTIVDSGKYTSGFENPENGFQAFTHDQENNVRNAEIYNNTVAGWKVAYSFDLGDSNPAQTVKVFQNNITYRPTGWYVRSSKTTFLAAGNNLFYGLGTTAFYGFSPDQGSLFQDPAFVDPAGQDYSLRTGSAAIDAGVAVYAGQTYAGARPDIGAWEFRAQAIFTDVPPAHPYYREIEALYRAGYTAGCATDPLRYCPDQAMNRAESAVFVERGVHSSTYDPSAPTSQVFDDLPLDSWAAKWVNGLWQDQYTAGCGTDPLVYCPWQGHSRAEGCVFYLRMLRGATYEPSQPSQQTFADVPLDAWYAKWAQAAHEAGLIPACSSSPEMRFCPDEPLSRGLAAYMMVKAKALP